MQLTRNNTVCIFDLSPDEGVAFAAATGGGLVADEDGDAEPVMLEDSVNEDVVARGRRIDEAIRRCVENDDRAETNHPRLYIIRVCGIVTAVSAKAEYMLTPEDGVLTFPFPTDIIARLRALHSKEKP